MKLDPYLYRFSRQVASRVYAKCSKEPLSESQLEYLYEILLKSERNKIKSHLITILQRGLVKEQIPKEKLLAKRSYSKVIDRLDIDKIKDSCQHMSVTKEDWTEVLTSFTKALPKTRESIKCALLKEWKRTMNLSL